MKLFWAGSSYNGEVTQGASMQHPHMRGSGAFTIPNVDRMIGDITLQAGINELQDNIGAKVLQLAARYVAAGLLYEVEE